jgi:hypothetical protein
VIDSKSYYNSVREIDPLRKLVRDYSSRENMEKGDRLNDWDYITNPNNKSCDCENCRSTPRARTEKSPRFEDYRLEYEEENKKPLSDHFYFLCDAVVYGYALKERTWGMLI